MNTNLERPPGARTVQGSSAGDVLPPAQRGDPGVHRFFRALDDTPLGRGTSEDAQFVGACIAAGALLGLVTAMARPTDGKRHG
jgi:hypothetical protein